MFLCVRLSVYLSVSAILGASASPKLDNLFVYTVERSRRSDNCKVCYNEDCYLLEENRCRYYSEADPIVRDTDDAEMEDEELKTQSDALLSDMAESVYADHSDKACVPLVSRYTDCTKENICTGCRSCDCDERGQWRCNSLQQCRVMAQPQIDHQLLATAIENLMNIDSNRRRKRSITDTESKLSSAEISEWLYDIHPYTTSAPVTVAAAVTLNDTKSTVPDRSTTSSFHFTKPSNNTDSEYVAFDEVLKSIINEDYKRDDLKQVEDNSTVELDYLNLEIEPMENNTSISTVNPEVNTVTEATFNSTSKVIIDLLDIMNNKYNFNKTKSSDYMDVDNKLDPDEDYRAYNLDAVHVMKRDVYRVNVESTTKAPENITESDHQDLHNNVLGPLTEAIMDKQKELNQLMHIRENLITFMGNKSLKNFTPKPRNNTDNKNVYFSMFKIEISPELGNDARKNDKNLRIRLMLKLKHDMNEVIKDIFMLKRELKLMSPELKHVIAAIKKFITKQGHEKKQGSLKALSPNLYNMIKTTVVGILTLLDKPEPRDSALDPLSPAARRIMKSVIHHAAMEAFIEADHYLHKPQNASFSDYLQSVGEKWKTLISDSAGKDHANRLYKLKMYHLSLMDDIHKITEAISYLDHSKNRRLDYNNDKESVLRINQELDSINTKILQFVNRHDLSSLIQPVMRASTQVPRSKMTNEKKISFLKRLKNLLANSKQDVVHFLKKQVPKSQMVKAIAQKKLDERAGNSRRSDNTVEPLLWRSTPDEKRKKRSIRKLDLVKQRMKNIIPNYLRGKVNPAIAANDKKKKGTRTSKYIISKPLNLASNNKTTINPKAVTNKSLNIMQKGKKVSKPNIMIVKAPVEVITTPVKF